MTNALSLTLAVASTLAAQPLAAPAVLLSAPGTEPGGQEGFDRGFDWVVPPDAIVFFDTDRQLVVDPVHDLEQLVTDGVLEVDEVVIGAGAQVRVTGSFPLRILATGEVRIDGEIDVSGFDAANVQSLNLATLPQPGGLGGPGGGDGGVGSPVTTMSSAQGGDGDGPLGLAGIGGEGGETGYSAFENNLWRGAGGGGGRFAAWDPDPQALAEPGEAGMDSTPFEPGTFDGEGAFGALSGTIPPEGGAVGATPFVDGSPRNDFWGVAIVQGQRVRGELRGLGAGSGGGGGGDAVDSAVFPTPEFKGPGLPLTLSDRKGGAGGGGGGALHIVALGEIVLGGSARIDAGGGAGGWGESSNFIDRVGGGGGGGSGGHVVLESGTRIVFEPPEEAPVLGAVGGEGAPGLPVEVTTPGIEEFQLIYEVLGYLVGHGGRGGPGVLQLHVPLPPSGSQEENLVLPDGWTLDELTTPTARVLLPIFLDPVAPAAR